MNDISIYHPELDRYVEVPESAFLIHARSGWVQKDPPPPADEADNELEALKAQAEELGLKVDGRWGAERLRAEIEAAESNPEGDEE